MARPGGRHLDRRTDPSPVPIHRDTGVSTFRGRNPIAALARLVPGGSGLGRQSLCPCPFGGRGARDRELPPSPPWGRGWLATRVFISGGETGEGVGTVNTEVTANRPHPLAPPEA